MQSQLPQAPRSISARRFLLIAAAAAVVVYLCPFGNKTDLALGERAMTTADAVVIVGNSVVDHVSQCDAVASPIPSLVGELAGARVADLSASGQLLEESIAYAGIALRNRSVKTVVMLVAYYSLADEWEPTMQRAAFLDVWSGISPFALDEVFERSGGFNGEELRFHDAFVYRGERYPDYSELKAAYFERELAAETCPEGNGVDSGFIDAYYHHAYLGAPINEQNVLAIGRLAARAGRDGKQVVVVLMPIDYQLMGTLDPAMVGAIESRVHSAVADIARLGVRVVDLSQLLPNQSFADRWCACGHLLQSGRETVTKAIVARALASDSGVTVGQSARTWKEVPTARAR